MTAPVLILGSEPRVVLTIARSLRRHGVTVDVAAPGGGPPRYSSRAVRKVFSLPGRVDQPTEFGRAVESLIAAEGYDTLIPCSDSTLSLVADRYEPLTRLLRVACPPPEVVRRVLDKDVTLAVARSVGILVPESIPITRPEELATLPDPVSFPIVAKDRSKSLLHRSTFKVRYFLDAEEMAKAWHEEPDLGERVLLQEFCPGEGVGVAMLMHHGEALVAFQHRRRKEYPSTGGVAALAVSEPVAPELRRQALDLLRALEWEGVAMVEFRQDRKTGRAVLMEVNGRYWGTCSLAVQSGVDIPLYEWQIAHGERPEIPPAYEAGKSWRWTAGYLQRLHELAFATPAGNGLSRPSVWRAIFEAPVDLGPWNVSATGCTWDPIPALKETTGTSSQLLRSTIKSLLRRVIPKSLLDHVRASHMLDRSERRAFHRLGLRRALGRRPGRPRTETIRFARSILFVCHGNIIRSALADALMRREWDGAADLKVASAGTRAVQGRQADERARLIARELGVSLDEHRAAPLSPEIVSNSDLIFVMDHRNEAGLITRFPDAEDRVFLLGIDSSGGGVEIADPYTGDIEEVRRAGRVIQDEIRNLVRTIREARSVG